MLGPVVIMQDSKINSILEKVILALVSLLDLSVPCVTLSDFQHDLNYDIQV